MSVRSARDLRCGDRDILISTNVRKRGGKEGYTLGRIIKTAEVDNGVQSHGRLVKGEYRLGEETYA